MNLSRADVDILGHVAGGRADAAIAAARARGWLEPGKTGGLKGHRERAELEAKLSTLGLRAPWL
jgi:hypothetical protein